MSAHPVRFAPGGSPRCGCGWSTDETGAAVTAVELPVPLCGAQDRARPAPGRVDDRAAPAARLAASRQRGPLR